MVMSKETLGLVLGVLAGVMTLALWLTDRAGKSNAILSAVALATIALLSLCAVYLIPWLWSPRLVERIWRVSFASALVLFAVARFGIWVWPARVTAKELHPAHETQVGEPQSARSEDQSTENNHKESGTNGTIRRGMQKKPADKSRNISQSNSGGINVQQGTTGDQSPIINSPITIGNVPKRILPQDKTSITKFLAGATRTTRIKIAVDQSSNARDFANDFYEVVKNAGWPMEDPGVQEFLGFSAPGKRFGGAVVIIRGSPLKPNETIYFDENEPMSYIGKVLEALKVPRILRREQDFSEGLIQVQFEGNLD